MHLKPLASISQSQLPEELPESEEEDEEEQSELEELSYPYDEYESDAE